MPPQPLIAISPNYLPPESRRFYQGKPLEYGESHLASAVSRAGAMPLMVYRTERTDDELTSWAADLIDRVDGLVLSGGQDIAPETYGESLQDPSWVGDRDRDAFEIALYRAAIAADKPVLGVCRGAQLIGVAEGGSLWQDLPSLRGAEHPTLHHREQERYCRLEHDLELLDDGFLARVFSDEPRVVNSVHHQALRREPPSLRVLARAPDGVAECFVRDDAWVLAIQWHPEWMQQRASQRRVFSIFAEACAAPAGLLW